MSNRYLEAKTSGSLSEVHSDFKIIALRPCPCLVKWIADNMLSEATSKQEKEDLKALLHIFSLILLSNSHILNMFPQKIKNKINPKKEMQCRNFNKCITKKNSAEEQSTTKELKKD